MDVTKTSNAAAIEADKIHLTNESQLQIKQSFNSCGDGIIKAELFDQTSTNSGFYDTNIAYANSFTNRRNQLKHSISSDLSKSTRTEPLKSCVKRRLSLIPIEEIKCQIASVINQRDRGIQTYGCNTKYDNIEEDINDQEINLRIENAGQSPDTTESKISGFPMSNEVDEIKEGNKRFRWNLLFNLLLWLVIPLPLWLPFCSEKIAVNILPIIQLIFMVCWLTVSILAWITYLRLYLAKDKTFVGGSDYEHLIVISTYKEPVSLLISTIESIKHQTSASSNVNLALSFEERTPTLDNKIQIITDTFEKAFKRIIFTSHPYGLPGEIPGKCSNANHGIRESMAVLHKEGVCTDRLIITTCDADTKFHPRFVSALAEKFSETKQQDQAVFQSPLLYNWKLDEASVVTRVTGIMRATLMMGALIPFNINTMSVFSFSGRLCKSGNFIHPNYQMDDIIALIRWMGVTGTRLKIVMVPVPTLSGPTSGRVLEEELCEWTEQARRWTIGAGEVFHYFMIKARRIPFMTSLSWGLTFVGYYGVLLCCSHLYGITLGISYYFFLPHDAGLFGINLPISYIIVHISLSILYLNSLSMFLLDWVCPKLLVPKPEERISLIRNVYQLIVSPLVITAYSLIEFLALQELAIRGKSTCNHKPSNKTNL